MPTIDIVTVGQVWQKGITVPKYDPRLIRKDLCGAWIRWDQYGNRKSQYGWEIDHVVPSSQNGSDSLSNLRPLQWQNNASRQDGRLICIVSAR
jgi:hypothetical protein